LGPKKLELPPNNGGQEESLILQCEPYQITNSIVHIYAKQLAHGVVCKIDNGSPVLMCNKHVVGDGDHFEFDLVWHGKRREFSQPIDIVKVMIGSEMETYRQSFQFNLIFNVGDIYLLRFVNKKGIVASPPVSSYKFHTLSHKLSNLDCVLLGCNICGQPNGYDVVDLDRCTYMINTVTGDCGRPLVHYDHKENRYYLLGIHRFGSNVKGIPNGFEPIKFDLPTLDLYEDYAMLEPAGFHGFLKEQGCQEGISYAYTLAGNEAIIKTNYMLDPLSELIPKKLVDRDKWELKDMCIENIIKGRQKYALHPNWSIFDLDHFKYIHKIFMNLWLPLLEHSWCGIDFETWYHVMQHGGQDEYKHSSPGYPFNQEYYDKITWLKHYGKDLWEQILSHFVVTIPCVATHSPKDEVRAVVKDQRMFAAMPIHHTGVGVYLFSGLLDWCKRRRFATDNPFSYGLNLLEMSEMFQKLFEFTHLGHSWDLDKCDTSLPESALTYFFSILRHFQPVNNLQLFDWYAQNAIYTYLKEPDCTVWMKDMGNPSGHYLTTLLNSMWSSFVTISTFVSLYMNDVKYKPIFLSDPIGMIKSHIYIKVTGDDTLVTYKSEPFYSKSNILGNLPPNVSITFDFPECEISDIHEVTFLSLKVCRNVLPQYRHIKFPMVHSKCDRMLVKMLYKRQTSDHTVMYEKVCNAICYMLFDSVWCPELLKLKHRLEEFYACHDLPFVYRSISDLERVRQIYIEEHMPETMLIRYHREQGMPLNEFSQFKSMNNATNGNNQRKYPSKTAKNRARRERKKLKKTFGGGSSPQSNIGKSKPKKKSNGMGPSGKKVPRHYDFDFVAGNPREVAYSSFSVPKNSFGEARFNGPVDLGPSIPHTITKCANGALAIDEDRDLYPAPCYTGSKHLSTYRQCATSSFLKNYDIGAEMLKTWIIQERRMDSCWLQTKQVTSKTPLIVGGGIVQDPDNLIIPEDDILTWEVPSGFFWGIVRNAKYIENGALMSFPPSNYGFTFQANYTFGIYHHVTFQMDLAGKDSFWIYISANSNSPDMAVYFLYYDPATLAAVKIQSIAVTYGGTYYPYQIMLPAEAQVDNCHLLMCIQNNQYDNGEVTLKTFFTSPVVSGSSTSLPVDFAYANSRVVADINKAVNYAVFNLEPVLPNFITNLLSLSDQFRLTSDLLVLTNTAQVQMMGGNLYRGLLESNKEFSGTWESYITTLPKNCKSDFKRGGQLFNMSCGAGFYFRPKAKFESNPFAGEWGRTHVAYITYANQVQGGNNDGFEVSFNSYRQIDYVNNNPISTRIQVVPVSDQWITYTNYVMRMYKYTDNPDHAKMLQAIKNAATWIMSGDDTATALRKGAATIGKAGAKLLPLLLSAVV
jgi:hypothetical protein